MDFSPESLHWYWFTAGVLLIAAEALIPGAVLMWFGVAALLTGALTLTTDVGGNGQLIFFSITAVSCIAVFKYWQKRNPPTFDEATARRLNQPGQELIGRKLKLATELTDGRGRVKVADSTWRCTGPDLPQGSEVRVVGLESGTLVVEAAEPDAS